MSDSIDIDKILLPRLYKLAMRDKDYYDLTRTLPLILSTEELDVLIDSISIDLATFSTIKGAADTPLANLTIEEAKRVEYWFTEVYEKLVENKEEIELAELKRIANIGAIT